MCDRISKEAVRKLKLKEETYHAIRKIISFLRYKHRMEVQDPGNLAVSMKLSASLNRLAGAIRKLEAGAKDKYADEWAVTEMDE